MTSLDRYLAEFCLDQRDAYILACEDRRRRPAEVAAHLNLAGFRITPRQVSQIASRINKATDESEAAA